MLRPFFRLLFLAIILSPQSVFPQVVNDNLSEIAVRRTQVNTFQKQRILKYLNQNQLKRVFSGSNGNTIQLMVGFPFISQH